MTGADPGPDVGRDDSEAQRAARRRRRLAALGDISADRSADDSDDGWSERDGGAATSDRDDELRRDVPPHHG